MENFYCGIIRQLPSKIIPYFGEIGLRTIFKSHTLAWIFFRLSFRNCKSCVYNNYFKVIVIACLELMSLWPWTDSPTHPWSPLPCPQSYIPATTISHPWVSDLPIPHIPMFHVSKHGSWSPYPQVPVNMVKICLFVCLFNCWWGICQVSSICRGVGCYLGK